MDIGRPKTAWKDDDYVLDDGQTVWQDNEAYEDGFFAGYIGTNLDHAWKYAAWYQRAFASGRESGMEAKEEMMTSERR